MSASLLVHQAYFGAVGGISHGQLASSLPDADLRTFLVAFTDRPGVVPPGVPLPPYLTATCHGPYYLLSRTWADTAVARAGMVFTHVLLLPLAAVALVPNLPALLRQLVPAPPPVAEREQPLPPLTLILPAEAEAAGPPAEVPASWLAVAHHLAEREPDVPLFLSGDPPDWEHLLGALWRGLPALLRPALTWGIRFTPPPEREQLPWLVYVPAELAERWRGKALLSLAPGTRRLPASALEQLVFGGEQTPTFQQFAAELGVVLDSFRLLRLGQQAYEVARRLRQAVASPQELLLLLRALNLLQPDPDRAVSLKEQAVGELARQLAGPTGMSVLALRNLPLTAFCAGPDRLGPVVAQGVAGLVLADQPAPAEQTGLLDQLAETDPARQQAWWQQAADAAFARALRPATPEAARVVWQGLVRSDATRAYVQQAVPGTADWEQQLQLAVPAQVTPAAAELVVAFGHNRGWWELIATVLAAAYAPADALRRQLRAEQALGLRESPRLRRLASRVPDAELLALALREPSRHLQELAGARAGQAPALLAALDVRQPAWRVIWAAALRHSRSLTAGIAQPAETIAALLAEVAGGRVREPELSELLEWVAASPFANVLALPARAHLWERLAAALRAGFLQPTLDALVAAVLAGTWTGTVEPALLQAGRDREFTTRLLHQHRDDATAVLAVDAVLANLRDEYLRDYLAYLPAPVGSVATRLGQLVADRRWLQSARALLARAGAEPAFRPALPECGHLLSFWEKLPYPFLFLGQASARLDGWQALQEELRQLYERGPDESGIWRRAGGDPAELLLATTRAAQWTAALRLLRTGGGGAITVQSLLLAARTQYPNNEHLRALALAPHLFTTR